MEEVKVLNTGLSSFGMRVLIALEEKGVKYEYQEEDLSNKRELLLKMNPVYKKIPVLIHNGNPICESLIILHYIDEAWPSEQFLPSKPYDRALARFWADFVDKKFYDSTTRLLRSKPGEAQEEAKREMLESLEILEGALKEMSGGGPYFGGEEFGFMDIAFIPFAFWLHTFETVWNFSVPFEAEFPLIHAWVNKCRERESVKKFVPTPERALEYGIEMRKRYE